MHYLDLTLPTPAENLALDEALLDEAERSREPIETLRLWEPAELMVVVGRSSKVTVEVHEAQCRHLGVPILRRTSGGAAVVTGPGCLMYALVLDFRLRPELRVVDHAHRVVLDTIAAALRPLAPEVGRQGISDLAILRDCHARKFSGNSMRMKREHLLYHGTILYDFPIEWIARLLAMPPRTPDYRDGRGHESFLANLPLDAAAIRATIQYAWNADLPCTGWPCEAVARLATERYGREEWNR